MEKSLKTTEKPTEMASGRRSRHGSDFVASSGSPAMDASSLRELGDLVSSELKRDIPTGRKLYKKVIRNDDDGTLHSRIYDDLWL